MKSHFLFPRSFKLVGWLLFVPSFAVAIAVVCADIDIDNMLTTKVFAIADNGLFADAGFFRFNQNSIGDEVLLSFLIVGGLFIGFSKQKNEDEFIAKIRYESLVWATYFNFGVMLLATWFIYGFFYFEVLIANVFSLLLFFVVRFHIKLYQLKKSLRDDE
ncbi:hypothetical protein HUK80_01615 [Flavobacterium sp. MAH-1]|uniref:Uncharacterized protein n=1 Tax=Flavobacterium agri TaxID=2743471 RepID=A0A7Y9C3Y3_9FLAO|nr:hypothetical protein [Flavobacterium agri]NUY79576.1 hypothetical protein [Flavobacterium agri]NYA69601.1 hypothetical protein [Flavobacterium agri]